MRGRILHCPSHESRKVLLYNGFRLVFGSQVVPIPHVSAAAKTNRYSYVGDNILSFLRSPSSKRLQGDLRDRSSSSHKSRQWFILRLQSRFSIYLQNSFRSWSVHLFVNINIYTWYCNRVGVFVFFLILEVKSSQS